MIYVAYADGSVAFADPLGAFAPHPGIAARLAGGDATHVVVAGEAHLERQEDDVSCGYRVVEFARALLGQT